MNIQMNADKTNRPIGLWPGAIALVNYRIRPSDCC